MGAWGREEEEEEEEKAAATWAAELQKAMYWVRVRAAVRPWYCAGALGCEDVFQGRQRGGREEEGEGDIPGLCSRCCAHPESCAGLLDCGGLAVWG